MAICILYLCTGNSCRSQMAEGWTRHLGSNVFTAESAGIEAHGKNPQDSLAPGRPGKSNGQRGRNHGRFSRYP